MQFQSNRYLVWQLIPAGITAFLAIRIHRTQPRRNGLLLLEVMLFAAAFWSLANVVQFSSPNMVWQEFWLKASHLAIVIIPTAWLLLTVEYSGILQILIRRFKPILYLVPVFSLLAVLTNADHHFFYSSSSITLVEGFASLSVVGGPLFYVHQWYSYCLIALGVGILAWAMFRNLRRSGLQVYALILGILLPLAINIFYNRGVFPLGFPDPTPISFAISGVAFAYVIYSYRIQEVVPIAHESIISDLSIGVLVLDFDNRVLEANQTAVEYLAFDQPDQFNKPLAELLQSDPVLLQNLQNALDEDVDADKRISIVPCGTSQTFEVHISAIRDEQGVVQGRVLQITDISTQLQVEKNLADSRIKLNSILDSLQDYYFETDIRGNVLYINKSFYSHLGYSSMDDLIGRNFRHFTTRETMRSVYENFKKLYETRESVTLYRYEYHTKDGSSFIGETTISPILDDNEVIGARGVLRNITDQVRAEENLLLAKEEAESRVNELTAINRIASISTSSLDLEMILQSLCVELTRMFPVRNAGINLVEPGLEAMKIAAFHSLESGESGTIGSTLPLEEYSARKEVLTKGSTVIFTTLPKTREKRGTDDARNQENSLTTIIVPIKTRDGTSGTIDMAVWDSSRIFDQNEITLAETIAYQVAAAIDNANLYEKTENELGVVEQEMEIGRQVQSSFFPDSIPEIEGWEFASHFEPSRQVAGDFYDFFKFKQSDMLAVVIADVVDKGVGAALFMVLFRSLLRAFSRVEVNEDNADRQLKRIISRTNDYIAEIHGDTSMFATIFMGILDPESGRLHYVNGGHESPVILDIKGCIVRDLVPTGPAVGVIPRAEFQIETVNLKQGDFLVGYTDGTTDAQSEAGLEFTKERLLKYIQYPWTSLFSMIFEVKSELHRFAGSRQQFDDITMISMRRKLSRETGKQSVCREARLEFLPELIEFVESSYLYCKGHPDHAVLLRDAAENACGYIIRNGYQKAAPGVISIECEKNGEYARLIIRDDGQYIRDMIEITPERSNGSSSGIAYPAILQIPAPVAIVSYEQMNGSGNQLVLEMKLDTKEPMESGR